MRVTLPPRNDTRISPSARAEGNDDGPYTVVVPEQYSGTFELRIGLLSKTSGGRSRVAGLGDYDRGARGLLGKITLTGEGADSKLTWQGAE